MISFLQANGLHIPLPDASVHCVVTSPPYLWQRLYDCERSVWGGVPGCEHEWEWFVFRPNDSGGDGIVKSTINGGHAPQVESRKTNEVHQAFCTHCNAFYGWLGLEPTIALYLDHLITIFTEVYRVLRPDGHLFVNIGDKRSHDRQWLGVPWRFAFAMQDAGWRLEDSIIWHKPAPMPGSQQNRFTRDFEDVFMFNKSKAAFFDTDAVREAGSKNSHGGGIPGEHRYAHRSGRNDGESLALCIPRRRVVGHTRTRRAVWRISHGGGYKGEHFAPMPMELAEICIKATTSERGVCCTCGTPWGRTTKRESNTPTDSATRGHPGRHGDTGNGVKGLPRIGDIEVKVTTTGFTPRCTCPTNTTTPAVVLDPFGGTGTVAIAADVLGHHGLAMDISGEYCHLARNRYAGEVAKRQGGKRGTVSFEAVQRGVIGTQERLI